MIYSKVECHDKNQSNLAMYRKKNGIVKKKKSNLVMKSMGTCRGENRLTLVMYNTRI